MNGQEKALSPVIGVILMVCIVVIIASVIAAFVFGSASQLTDNATRQHYTPIFDIGYNDGLNESFNPEYRGYDAYLMGYQTGILIINCNCSKGVGKNE